MENLEIEMIKNKWRREQLKSELALAQLKADNTRTDSYMCKITGVPIPPENKTLSTAELLRLSYFIW